MEDTALKIIAEYIKNSLLRVTGKELEVSITETKRDNLYTFETSAFNTMPVLFKSIYIYGDIFVSQDKETEDLTIFNIRFNYGFEYFNGGSNGTELGNMSLVKSKNCNMISVKNEFTYIRQSNIYPKI